LSGKARIAWLDVAKALGIFLVFYGHLLETMIQVGGRPFLLSQLKVIYAFHMPLFFLLSGYLYRDKKQSFGRFFRIHLLTRLIPFFFFNLLALAALLVQQAGRGGIDWQMVGQGCLAMFRGTPSFNMLTWFLACLFMVELIHFGTKRWLVTPPQLLLGIGLSLILGLPVARWAANFLAETGIYVNFWYVQEALTAYAFYLMGVLACHRFKRDFSFLGHNRLGLIGFVVLWGGVTWVTAVYNQGPFVTEPGIVLMSISSHGSFFWFPVTAVTGTLFIIFLATIVPGNRALLYFGQKTLILLGMGGLFFEFFNQPLVAITNPFFPASPLVTIIQAVLLTVLSFGICVPFIYMLEKFFPQLVGKPGRTGPILPRFI
jgi:acyltransferase